MWGVYNDCIRCINIGLLTICILLFIKSHFNNILYIYRQNTNLNNRKGKIKRLTRSIANDERIYISIKIIPAQYPCYKGGCVGAFCDILYKIVSYFFIADYINFHM